MLQAREKTNKRFHGAIPKLLHSIKHSHSKADPTDDELHHVHHAFQSNVIYSLLSSRESIWLWISFKQYSPIYPHWKRMILLIHVTISLVNHFFSPLQISYADRTHFFHLIIDHFRPI